MTDEHIFRPKYIWRHWWQLVEPLAGFLPPAFLYVISEESRRDLLSVMLTKGIASDFQSILPPFSPSTLVFIAILGSFVLMGMVGFLASGHIQKLSYDNDGLWLHRGLGKRLHIADHSVAWADAELALGKRHRFGLERLANKDQLWGFLAGYMALVPERAELSMGKLPEPKKPLSRWYDWKVLLVMVAAAALLVLLFYPWQFNLTVQTLWIIDGVLGAAACVKLVFLIRRVIVAAEC